MSGLDEKPGLTARQARRVEFGIIGLCIAALVMIFQPFSLTLFGIGTIAARMMSRSGISRNSIIRKAAEPRIGGVICWGDCTEDDVSTDLSFPEQALDALGWREQRPLQTGVAQAAAR